MLASNEDSVPAEPPNKEVPPPSSSPSTISVPRQNSFNSVNSDHCWTDRSRVVTLRASNPEVTTPVHLPLFIMTFNMTAVMFISDEVVVGDDITEGDGSPMSQHSF